MVFCLVPEPLTFSRAVLLAQQLLLTFNGIVSLNLRFIVQHTLCGILYVVWLYLGGLDWILIVTFELYDYFLDWSTSLCDTPTKVRICASLGSLVYHISDVRMLLYLFMSISLTFYDVNVCLCLNLSSWYPCSPWVVGMRMSIRDWISVSQFLSKSHWQCISCSSIPWYFLSWLNPDWNDTSLWYPF